MCWNCRGSGNKDFLGKMRELLKEHGLTIVVLLEPTISGLTANGVCQKLGRRSWIRSKAAGFSGGIWVLWEEEVIEV